MLNKRNIFGKISAELFVKFLTIIVNIFANTEMLDNFREKGNFQEMNMIGCKDIEVKQLHHV